MMSLDSDSSITRNEYEKAFNECHPRTVGFLLSKGAGCDLAEELAQAAWARGWERRHQLRDSGSLLPWVNTIALNKFRNTVRANKREVELDESFPSGEGKINLSAMDAERILNACRECDRCLLEKHYLKGCRIDEMAVEYGVKPSTVRVRLHRARKSVAEQLRCRPHARTGAVRPLCFAASEHLAEAA